MAKCFVSFEKFGSECFNPDPALNLNTFIKMSKQPVIEMTKVCHQKINLRREA